jgi:hypothetical protein
MLVCLTNIQAQRLSIKGAFVNSDDDALTAHYVIKSGDKHIACGDANKIKLKLELNKNYSLTVSKPGYKSKTVHFSTYTLYEKKFSFSFLVLMFEEPILDPKQNENDAFVAGDVFFDGNVSDFN